MIISLLLKKNSKIFIFYLYLLLRYLCKCSQSLNDANLIDDAICNISCNGNSSQTCGGISQNTVYKINSNQIHYMIYYKYIKLNLLRFKFES